jgi:oligoribonuclease
MMTLFLLFGDFTMTMHAIELRKDLLIWVDLETTGLDIADKLSGAQYHKILEVGIHITDSKFNIIDEGFEVVIHHDVEEAKALTNDYVRDMHITSGLWDRVDQSTVSLEQAEEMMLAYIAKFNISPKSSPICGNSVSLDRNFIMAQMPKFADVLHYRIIDVSTIKEIVWRVKPEVGAMVKKQEKHRGLEDIKESIAEYKIYEEFFFR